MNPLERQFFPQRGLNKYLGLGSMADEYIQGGGLFGALMNYSPHLAEAKNRLLPQAQTAAEYIGPAADMQDMKHYSGAAIDELRAGNYAPALANLGMTGAAMAMTALPGNVGAVDDVVKRADFEKMASRGKVHQARATEAENIKAVQDGDAKAFKFEDIDDYEYESGDFTDRVSKTGLYIDDDMYGTVYAGKTKEDVEALKSAKTPIEYGRAAGYSEDDIATFYIARRRGDAGIAFDEYISDLKTAGPAKATTDDLPMDTASRMKRAEEMGFEDGYHGTAHPFPEGEDAAIEQFKVSAMGKRSINDEGYLGKGVYTFDTPKYSNFYAEYGPGLNPTMYPLKTRGKYLRLEGREEDYVKGVLPDPRQAHVREALGLPKSASAGEVTEAAQSAGYDGVEYIYPKGDWFPDGGRERVTFEPKNVRSRFAKFDPAKKDSADLLASIGGVGLLGALGLSQSDEFNERY